MNETGDIKVGDWIEVTEAFGDGEGATYTGKVVALDGQGVETTYYYLSLNMSDRTRTIKKIPAPAPAEPQGFGSRVSWTAWGGQTERAVRVGPDIDGPWLDTGGCRYDWYEISRLPSLTIEEDVK